MADVSRFSTRMTWDGTGNGHWDVVLTQSVNGRSVLLATIPLDEWIDLGATQYVLELEAEGGEVLKPHDLPLGLSRPELEDARTANKGTRICGEAL
jgi:hypothetical protein